jgi:hypothetical protein
MANLNDTAAVLAEWRGVERQLDAAVEGTPEAEHLQAEAARLRDEIRELTTPRPALSTEAMAEAS